MPLGCLGLVLVGIALGVSSGKGGKWGGYVLAIVLAFFCYYLTFLTLINFAKQGKLPVEFAAWAPNVAFTIWGIIFLARLEKPGDRDFLGAIRSWIIGLYPGVGKKLSLPPQVARVRRFSLLCQ